jgi:hypothetical protein
VDAAGPPGVDALGAAHAGFADERVPAAVVVAGVVVRAVVILLLKDYVRMGQKRG